MLLSELDWKTNVSNISVAVVDVPGGIAVLSFDAQRSTYDVAHYPSGPIQSSHWTRLDVLSAQCVLFEIEGASSDVG